MDPSYRFQGFFVLLNAQTDRSRWKSEVSGVIIKIALLYGRFSRRSAVISSIFRLTWSTRPTTRNQENRMAAARTEAAISTIPKRIFMDVA
jgi:hypothetical protein